MRQRIKAQKVNVQQELTELKAKKVRFYELQREIFGDKIKEELINNPELSLWEATQKVYKESKSETKDEKYARLWEEMKTRFKDSLSSTNSQSSQQ
jgi:hypothetical protein